MTITTHSPRSTLPCTFSRYYCPLGKCSDFRQRLCIAVCASVAQTGTKTGNSLARTCLVEAAWTYRHPARVTQIIRERLNGLPEPIRAIAWKAQVRLTSRYRKLIAAGKPAPKAIVAIARELVGFIWAIARLVDPKAA